MDWIQFAIMTVTFVGLFTWNRSESRADIRHMDSKLESTRELVRAIHDEMKDFHNKLALQDQEFKMRLCAIEEKNRK
jgi:hypothetical protein